MGRIDTQVWQALLDDHDRGDELVVIVDSGFVLRAASERTQEAFAVPLSDVIDQSIVGLIHESDLERALGAFEQTTSHEGLRPPDVYRVKQGLDTYKPFDVSGETVMEGAAVVFRLSEITNRRRAEMLAIEQIEVLELQGSGRPRSECLTALANLCDRHVEGSVAIVHVPTPDGNLEQICASPIPDDIRARFVNQTLRDPGGNLSEAAERGLSFIEHGLTDLPHWAAVSSSLEHAEYRSCVTTPAHRPTGELAGFVEVLRRSDRRPDNAELSVHALVGRLIGLILDRMSFEEALSEAAFTDELTGLGNRRQLQEHMRGLSMRREPFGLLGIDIDQFAWINNNLGHAAGDQLLIEVSRRLRSALPPDAEAFRPGGDEFVIVVEHERRSEDLLAIAKNLLAVMREPMSLAKTERRVNASIGISKSVGGSDPERVLARADAAMYAAKREGGAGVRMFSEPIGQEMMRRMALADELRGAIANNELRLVYQPVIDLATMRVAGVEALVRWEHPSHGLLGPNEFVPVAEESTLILELDEWVLTRASAQLDRWTATRTPLNPLELWVNLSARSFIRPDLRRLLDKVATPSARGRIGLELTERDPIEDLEGAIRAFQRLRSDGVLIAIDDFGTGLASLQRVADFEPSNIKIDRSFVSRMSTSPKFQMVVESIIDIGRRFDLIVTAEGVEELGQLAVLQELGCHHAQGFLFARPMVVSDLERLFGSSIDGIWSPSVTNETADRLNV